MPQSKKREMRNDMRRILKNLDERWISVAQVEIDHHLVEFIEQKRAGEIDTFLAWVPSFVGEIDLSVFIGSMLRRGKVYLPRVVRGSNMVFVQVNEEWSSSLEKSERGVYQPREGSGPAFVPSSGAGVLVLVPGLAFDREGKRLGRGGGYYDRFLAAPELSESVKIGVCWSVQFLTNLPSEPHDVEMDWICHERGIVAPCAGVSRQL
jgi:5-formyltetrahydrofolate cyclo-ligase